MTAQERRAARVLCCLVAVRDRGVVTEAYLKAACGMATRFVHQAIRDLRAMGFCIVRYEHCGWQLWEPVDAVGL